MTETDQHTLAYLSTLPLVLAPLPDFSSCSSRTLNSHHPTPSATFQWTKCSACQAEIIGGVSGSYWTERGVLWASCGGCGWTSRRGEQAKAVAGGSGAAQKEGKAQFEPVRKRRKLQEKPKQALHPTAMRKETASSAPTSSAVAKGKRKAVETNVETNASSISTSTSPHPPSTLPPRPTSAPPSRASALPPPLRSAPALPSSIPSTSTRPPAPVSKPSSAAASPAPSSASSTNPPSSTAGASSSTTKKKKRTKQASGLAEMLEAKKKREKETASGSTGLMDFLQGL